MNDQDERFFFSSLLGLLAESVPLETAAERVGQLLERLFAPARVEIWLAGQQGRLSRLDWSAQPRAELGQYKLELGRAGWLLLETTEAFEAGRLRQLERCSQLAAGPLSTLLQQEESRAKIAQLEERQQRLETESNWLQHCLALMQGGEQLLDGRRVLEQLTPLTLEAFPSDGLVLGRPTEAGWQTEALHGSEASVPVELWQRCLDYGKVIHFEDLGPTRFGAAMPGVTGLTVAPLAFSLGVLCRYSLGDAGESSRRLRNFELAAQLLGYLLKIGQLHGEVAEAYRALQESELQRAGAVKLAAIGQIAAGVAHEMNTPLASVKLTLDGVARDAGLSSTSQKTLKLAQQSVLRCQEVARELLSFSREASKEHRFAVDLQEAVRRAVNLSEKWAQSRQVQLQAEWLEGPLVVEANLGKLQEILLHLLENALWAAGAGGRVRVWLERGAQLEVRVSDTGPGVPAELHQRIFEPFFTTRPMGEATGLGLALSRRLAQEFEGELLLEESSPAGSVFCLRLPASSATIRNTLK